QQLAIVGDKLKAALEVELLTIWLCDSEAQSLYAARSWSDTSGDQDAQAAPPAIGDLRISVDDPKDLIARAFRLGEILFEPQPSVSSQGGLVPALVCGAGGAADRAAHHDPR